MSTVVNLASLGSAGFIIQGDSQGDLAGFSISDAGDVNGDGFDDVIVGAPYNDAGGTDAGAAYVIYGRSDGFADIDLTNLQPGDGFKIQGDLAGDLAGLSVSGGGDVNGDGFDDLIVGADRAFGMGGYGDVSRTYVVFGGASSSGPVDLTNLTPSDGFVITGLSQFQYYRSGSVRVSNAGDMNGDGFDDVVLSMEYANATYVVFGTSGGFGSNGVIDLTHLDPSAGFAITQGGSITASNLGDINGDGFDDIIIGAPYNGTAGTDAYVIYGHSGSFAAVNLTNLSPTVGFRIQDDSTQDATGLSVSGAGDINGDGFNDIIIGAPRADDGGVDSGNAYVIFGHAGGSATVDLTNLQSAAGFIIQGDAAGDEAGFAVSGAGDVNDDGFDDLLVGAVDNDSGAMDAGSAYVIYGHSGSFGTIDLTNLSPTAGFVIRGAVAGDLSGFRVSAAGDLNHDGADDLLVSAPFGDLGGINAGQVYVIFGTNAAGVNQHAENDFNGDGRSDILWRNTTTGQVVDWLATANSFNGNGSHSSSTVSADWQVAGTGDFNGDGRADILWRNTDGRIADWLGTGNGGFVGNGAHSHNAVSNAWQIAATGDFNGDGRDDILWRNTDGRIADWLGTGNGGFVGNGAHSHNAVSNAWQIAATGDFNGDGRDDILWQNSTTGRIVDWLGTASGGFTGNGANSGASVAAGWEIAGTGDFNGDGHDDILLRNSTTGQVSDWLGTATGGFTDNSAHSSATLSTDWQVATIGDYNGDGIDDILWRNPTTGELTDWLGNASGGFADNSAHAAATVATNWQVEPTAHMLV